MPVKGRGSCMIPNAKGFPCGRQIADGEPAGTVLVGVGGAAHGHKKCADEYLRRKQQQEREKVHSAMVKRVDQAGPGGPVDFSQARDAIMGSYPLVPPDKQDDEPALGELAAAAGVRSVAEIPFDEDPSAIDPAQYNRVRTEELRGQPPGWTPDEMEQLRAFQEQLKAKRPKSDAEQALTQARAANEGLGELSQRVGRLEGILKEKGILDD